MEPNSPTMTLRPSRPVVTPEQLARVEAHLKERHSQNPYYQARYAKDPDFFKSMAGSMPLLPL